MLSVVSMALGAAAVILVLNLSFRFREVIEEPAQSFESILVVANAEVSEDGSSTSWSGPGAFSSQTIGALAREYPGLTDLVPMAMGSTSLEIRVGEEFFRINRVVPTTPEYRELYALQMIAGSFLTEADLADRAPVAVVNDEIAKVLFGSAEAAVGKTVTRVQRMGPDADRRGQAITITGVYAAAEYTEQMMLGVADVVVPQTLFERFGSDNYRLIVGRLTDASYDEAVPQVEAVVRSLVDQDVPIAVWQGNPGGPQRGGILDAMESTVRSVSIFLGALGMVALLVSAFGIFSSMLVSILERTREIGLRRALGSTRLGLILHFLAESMLFTLAGVVLGIVIALFFNEPIAAGLSPMLTIGPPGTEPALSLGLGLRAVAVGGLLAVALGTVFGVIPAASAARVSPMESLRDQ